MTTTRPQLRGTAIGIVVEVANAVTRTRLVFAIVLAVCLPRSASADSEADADSGAELDKGELLYSCGKTRGKVVVRFKPDVELRELVTWAMGFTCKSFAYGAGIGGRSAKANLIVPGSMSVEQAWRVFLIGLETMGLTVVPRGEVLAIVEVSQARGGPVPLYLRGKPSRRVQIVRQMFRPEHTSADELARALELLKSKQGEVAALPELGLVLVTDFADHLGRMSALVGEVDRPHASETLFALKIRRVDAVELVKTLEELLGVGRRGASAPVRGARGKPPVNDASASGAAVPSTLIADGRTNTLLVVGSQAAFDRVRAVVDRLDIAVDGEASGSVHLYALANADAEELAGTLASLLSGRAQSTARNGGRAPAAAESAIEGSVQVAFDKPTNSLLFVASSRDYLALSQIVRRLDEPRRQVYIEATVFEVSATAERRLGLAAHAGKDTKSGGVIVGGFQPGTVSSLSAGGLANLSGLLGGIFGKALDNLTVAGNSVPSFGVAVQAMAMNGTVDILSEPHILTADNKEAVISVGRDIPYTSRLSALPSASGSGDSPFALAQSIERKKLALTLKITPHVSSDDLIRCDIELSKDDLIAGSESSTNGPSWGTSELKNSVVVHDQQTIVIGGIMSDSLEDETRKVPVLGDLPLFGHLFRSTTRVKRKTNLLVLLTPHIVGDQRDAQRILDRRMRERSEYLSALGSFDRMSFERGADYSRKRGLVEEINQVVAGVEREKALRRQLEQQMSEPIDGPITAPPRAPLSTAPAGSR